MFTLEEIFEEICVAIYEAIFNNVWDLWESIIFSCIGFAIVFGIKAILNLIK